MVDEEGTTRSPCPYDAAACQRSNQQVCNARDLALLVVGFPTSQGGPITLR